MVTIRGRQYDAENFTDRDLVWLASALGNSSGDYAQNEKNICTILRKIFPDFDPELTAGDVLLLHSAEMASVLQELNYQLNRNPDFAESLRNLPTLDTNPGFVQNKGPKYNQQQKKQYQRR